MNIKLPLVCTMLLTLLLESRTSKSQSFPVTTVIDNGPLTNRVNMAVLPDGYTQPEIPDFLQDIISVCDSAFNKSPFKEYRKFFNVYAIEVPSLESGTDHPATATDVTEPVIPFADVNTYFDTQFDGFSKHRFLITNNTAAVNTVLANNFPSYDQILVLVNSPEYGGTGGAISTVSTNSFVADVTVHEWGHSFAGLADEYWPGWGSEKPNMTADNNQITIKWHDWLNVNNITIVPHFDPVTLTFQPWYRPSTECEMENVNYNFCSVCQEAIINSIYDVVSPIDNALPDTTVALNYTSTPLQFTINLVKPDPYTLKVRWKLNGSFLPGTDTTIQITGAQLTAGANVLQAFVTDTTLLSRSYWPSAGYQFSAGWDINKTATGIAEINNNANNNRFFYKLYPIPANDRVTFEYDNKTRDNSTTYNIIDISGRLVKSGQLDIVNGKQKTSIDIADLASGSYLFHLKSSNINVETKLTKL